MADPLSIAASAAGLISLGIQSTEYLIKFYTRCKDRDTDIAKTIGQLQSLRDSLQSIDKAVSVRRWRPGEEDIRRRIEESISSCEISIRDLHFETQRFQSGPNPNLTSMVKKAGRLVTYPFKHGTLENLREYVESCRNNLSTALQTLELKEHQNTQDELEIVLAILKTVQAQQVGAAVREWLKAPDATIDYNAACTKRHASTGKWFVKSPEYQKWIGEDNSFLWLNGFAGCGKSILCSTAILHAFRHVYQNPGATLGFFFFSFTDQSKQDASALLRALLLQLSGQIREVENDLDRLRGTHSHGTPPVHVLLEHLRGAISRSSQTFLLIDALDECPRESTRSEVLSVIRSMKQWSLRNLHLLVTSRPEPDIRLEFSNLSGQNIAMINDSIDQDIRDYVSSKLEDDLQLSRLHQHHAKIRDHFTKHANGVFRWVDCQLNSLRQCPSSARHVDKCLRSLPRTLDETYERILCNVPDESTEEARRLLTLLCFSPRPMTAPEIIDALAVDTSLRCIDDERRLADADDLYQICPGLIETYRGPCPDYYLANYRFSSDDSKDDENEVKEEEEQEELEKDDGDRYREDVLIVRIAHFSVQEYLESERIKQGHAADFAMSRAVGRVHISSICLVYLCDRTFLDIAVTGQMVKRYPFAIFAAWSWYDDNPQNSHGSTTELQELEIALFMNVKAFEKWLRLRDVEGLWGVQTTYDDEDKIHPSSIYVAALLGLSCIVEVLLSVEESNINARVGACGTALQAAAAKGHERVVELLVQHGADINAQGGKFGTALRAASYEGRETIALMLLERGADVNAQSRYDNALTAASASGFMTMGQTLLERWADANALEGRYGTALQAASYRGFETIVRMLLERGADVNTRANNISALQVAAARGHEIILQLLLEHGADVNAQGGYHGSALQTAAAHNHIESVQLLLEHGADVNAQGGRFGSAIQAAKQWDYETVVQMLRERGAHEPSDDA